MTEPSQGARRRTVGAAANDEQKPAGEERVRGGQLGTGAAGVSGRLRGISGTSVQFFYSALSPYYTT